MKYTHLLLSLLAVFFLCGCDSCDVVRVAEGKLHFSDGKSTPIPHWNEEGWTIFFIVRHAEKLDASDDTDLSPAGYARAARLGGIMENAGLDQVFVTDKLRSLKTGEPVQLRSHTPPVLRYSRDDAAETAWLQQQLSVNRGKHLFVVAHTNTIPRIINKLMGPSSSLTDLDEHNYSSFFVVASRGMGNSEYLWRSY